MGLFVLAAAADIAKALFTELPEAEQLRIIDVLRANTRRCFINAPLYRM